MKTNWKYVIEPRDYGFAIVKHFPDSKRNYRELVAMFEPQPDGSIIRTFSYSGFPTMLFTGLVDVKMFYGID